MPDIKIKHIVSFSSEDKVHKAGNVIKSETYRKWKCATPGEKSATIVLQFEKASQIHSIEIGNEGSAFVEVLVGRSSDTTIDYEVLLVASSFMSPLESRNGTCTDRVRTFEPEKLSPNIRDQKWDCVQICCTQPFNKTVTYGLTFIKFYSPPGKIDELAANPEAEKSTTKLGAFTLKDDDDDDDNLLCVGSWFGKKNQVQESSGSAVNKTAPSYADAVLASSSSNSPTFPPQGNTQKRKIEKCNASEEPPLKKYPTVAVSKEHSVCRNMEQNTVVNRRESDRNGNTESPKTAIHKKTPEAKPLEKSSEANPKAVNNKKTPASKPLNNPSSNTSVNLRQKIPFDRIMDRVVFVLSGFVNPLRSELRDKALQMGAKYKPDWDSTCTHLVCAFTNTPKYDQVKKQSGQIVAKEWIIDCYKRKSKLPWINYMLGRSSNDSSSGSEYNAAEDSSADETDFSETKSEDFSETESEEEYGSKKKKKKPQTLSQRARNRKENSPKKKPSSAIKNRDTPKSSNSSTPSSKDPFNTPEKKVGSSIFNKLKQSIQAGVSDTSQSPKPHTARDESETEDEDALQDYAAATDVEDSGGDTEDEIRKVEMKAVKKNIKDPKTNGVKNDSELLKKPDVSNLPLPNLPNFFRQKHFFLFGEFSATKLHDINRYVIAYNGIVEDYMSDKIKYVITDEKWDQNFDDAVSANEDIIFIKPAWIYKCHESKKLVPYQPFIVIPDS